MNAPVQHPLLKQFQSFFTREQIQVSSPLLLAVSGGLDSVVLCALCSQAQLPFVIAHCNFQLRGEESERDENFVRSLEQPYQTTVLVKRFETESFAKEHKYSIQEAARTLRYNWFRELKANNNYSYIVLAHHADDNIETVLMHFFRGTGLQGLTGMPARTTDLLRPLLDVRRKDIHAFAEANSLQWVDDSSNLSSYYTRNFFRNELIPSIKKFYPQVEENLLDNMQRLRSVEQFYALAMHEKLQEICEEKGAETWIPVRKIRKHDYRLLLFEIIRKFGFGEKQVDEVVKLMDSTPGHYMENASYQIIRHGLWLIIAPKNLESGWYVIDRDREQLNFPGGELTIHIKDASDHVLQRSASVAQLDASCVEFPLVVRKWKQGDYFYPFGLRKKKKLARFFIDQKLAKHQKEKVWVVESNKKIIWVIGMRIDDRCRITPSTKKLLLLTLKNEVL